jgi:phosphosulfolactate phosphohydrolase-like enzyme
MTGVVAVERYPSLGPADPDWTVVGVDVIRATTTAVTAVAAGRRCFPVASLEEAVPLARRAGGTDRRDRQGGKRKTVRRGRQGAQR